MRDFSETFKQTEGKSRKHTQDICEIIINEIERYYGVRFIERVNGVTSGAMVQIILMNPEYEIYRDYLLELLCYYEVNEYAVLLRLINLINQYNLPTDARCIFEQSFSLVPFHSGVKRFANHLEILTSRGLVKVYNLRNWLQSERFEYYVHRGDFRGHCHEVVQLFRNEFTNGLITTSKMPELFGGSFFHSYYSIASGGGVIDIASNTYYEGDCFTEVFRPKEIIKYPAQELETRYGDLIRKVKEVPRTMAPVLSLALNEIHNRY